MSVVDQAVDYRAALERLPYRDKIAVQPNGCWLWLGGRQSQGYGKFDGTRLAHRVVYEDIVGPIPPHGENGARIHLDHLCRVRPCCNPAHVEVVTERENILRGTSPTAIAASKTQCKRGHPLEGENLYVASDGHRRCRTCMQAANRRRFAA